MKFRLKSGRRISISIGDKKAGAHRQAKIETYKQVRIGGKRKEMVYKITVQKQGSCPGSPRNMLCVQPSATLVLLEGARPSSKLNLCAQSLNYSSSSRYASLSSSQPSTPSAEQSTSQ